MAYYLTIKNNKNYKTLDITSFEEFIRISKFNNESYCLEEIDKFTINFEDEISLKRKLYNKGIITIDEITKEISIRRKTKGNLEIVPYGLVYKNTAKYLDIYYLKNKLLELQNDKEFLNKLITHYRNSYINQSSVAAIRALLLDCYNNELNMSDELNNFFIREIYDIDYKTGLSKLKYKSLHDLAMFVHNYITKKEKSNTEIENNNTSINEELNILKNSLNTPNIKTKKRTKNLKEQIEGQTSFF